MGLKTCRIWERLSCSFDLTLSLEKLFICENMYRLNYFKSLLLNYSIKLNQSAYLLILCSFTGKFSKIILSVILRNINMFLAFYLTIISIDINVSLCKIFHITKIICPRQFSTVCNKKPQPWPQILIMASGSLFLLLNLQSQILNLGFQRLGPGFLFLHSGSQFLIPGLKFPDLSSSVLGYGLWVLVPMYPVITKKRDRKQLK